jgi:hypothetical protein
MNHKTITVETVSGQIKEFRKITPTLATFRLSGIACKAEHNAVAYVERWSEQARCTCEFQGSYQRSRFGREFVVVHGRVIVSANPSTKPQVDGDVETNPSGVDESPAQLESAIALPQTETMPAKVLLATDVNSSPGSTLMETEGVRGERSNGNINIPSRTERFEPLIQQQMKTYRSYYSSKELNTMLNSGSPIAREAARRVLAEGVQLMGIACRTVD